MLVWPLAVVEDDARIVCQLLDTDSLGAAENG
jgi:hypothetical protein